MKRAERERRKEAAERAAEEAELARVALEGGLSQGALAVIRQRARQVAEAIANGGLPQPVEDALARYWGRESHHARIFRCPPGVSFAARGKPEGV